MTVIIDFDELSNQYYNLYQSDQSIIRIEVPIETVDPYEWLLGQSIKSQYFWSDRNSTDWMAGLGESIVLEGKEDPPLDYIKKILNRVHSHRLTTPRFFGGTRFQKTATSLKNWEAFQYYRFVLPKYEIVHQSGATVFVVNILKETITNETLLLDDLIADISSFKQSIPLSTVSLRVTNQSSAPNFSEWKSIVNQALMDINQNQYQKIVLSRQVTYELESYIHPVFFLKKGLDQNCFQFLFMPESHRAFLGISPELLFHQSSADLEIDAIAGTIERGKNMIDDQALEHQLLNSIKDQAEHQVVINGISSRLEAHNMPFEILDQQVLKLNQIQHLYTPIRAMVGPDQSSNALLSLLHPTPAVGGFPTKETLARIESYEPFDRGCFAGPVGWISADDVRFVVAIRSSLMINRDIHLFSGAGIVRGSNPEREWQELDQKLGYIGELLNEARE